MNAPALLIAGTHSGCGKTTVTLGVMAALKRRGFTVRPFKCGPDFIDPSLHRMVTGQPSYNLDVRMCGETYIRASFGRHNPPGANRSVAVVEGVMGLFDGGQGSAAMLAKSLGLPVILVVDVRSAAESVAAVVKGFHTLDPDLQLAGVICNRIGSARHAALIRGALEPLKVPLLGFLPREEEITIPSRHLGLKQGEEAPLSPMALDKLAALMADNLDWDRLLAIAEMAETVREWPAPPAPPALPRVRLGVARDAAFSFYYEDNLELLREAGAELVFFSPLADATLPENISGLYLGGGYPELFARRLAENATMRAAIKAFSQRGAPVYAECGGFMYLAESLHDVDGQCWPMTGIFPFACTMHPRLKSLGYREPVQMEKSFFGPAGLQLYGHEFHYSALATLPAGGIWRCEAGGTAYRVGNTVAGYIHLHWGRSPEVAAHFVRACADFNKG